MKGKKPRISKTPETTPPCPRCVFVGGFRHLVEKTGYKYGDVWLCKNNLDHPHSHMRPRPKDRVLAWRAADAPAVTGEFPEYDWKNIARCQGPVYRAGLREAARMGLVCKRKADLCGGNSKD